MLALLERQDKRPVTARRTAGHGSGKRALDIVVGALLALLALPLIMAIAASVVVSLRTSRPFFTQARVGRGGRLFTVLKLRTLSPDSPCNADKYAVASMQSTRLCRFLRRTHLDELPQLLLVPLGHMSLVGPRPEMPWLLERFDRQFVAARSSVRPGCSGLWQVSRDVDKLIGEVPEYDLYYLSHAGVRLDLWILWRTVLSFVGLGRPVTCADVPLWALAVRPDPAAFPPLVDIRLGTEP